MATDWRSFTYLTDEMSALAATERAEAEEAARFVQERQGKTVLAVVMEAIRYGREQALAKSRAESARQAQDRFAMLDLEDGPRARELRTSLDIAMEKVERAARR